MENQNDTKSRLSDFNQFLLKAVQSNEESEEIETPYISVNKLAEYAASTSATRRSAIIKSLKEDKDFKKRYYSIARNSLHGFFQSNYDETVIDRAVANALQKDIQSDWDKTDRNNSILALESLKSGNLPDISEYELINPSNDLEFIMLSGVRVTIKPEIYLQNKTNGKLGAVKFHLAKTKSSRLSQIAMQSVATCIKWGFLEKGLESKQLDSNGCISIDVFEGNFATSPATYKRTLENLRNACKEIFDRWDKV